MAFFPPWRALVRCYAFVCPNTFIHPHTFICALYVWIPPYVQTPPIWPQCSPVHLYVLGVSACDMGMQGPSICLDIPICLDASPYVQHPTHLYTPYTSVCSRGICMWYGGYTPYVGVWGASAHLSGFQHLSVHPLDVHYASSCTFLVVYYVSNLYYHG